MMAKNEPTPEGKNALLAAGLAVENEDGSIQLHPGITHESLDALIKIFEFLRAPITGIVTQEYVSRMDQVLVEFYARSGSPTEYVEMLEKQQVMMTGIAVYKLLTGDFPSEELRQTAEGRTQIRDKLAKVTGNEEFTDLVMSMLSEIYLSDVDARGFADALGYSQGEDAHECLSLPKLKEGQEAPPPRLTFGEIQTRLLPKNLSISAHA
jgi:hypothetical protein